MTDIQIAAQEAIKTKRLMAKVLARHTGKPVEQILADTERDRWLSAEEAKDYGLIDAVILPRPRGTEKPL